MRHLKVAIAALLSLMMIAVPLSCSVDSDALSGGDSGITFIGKNISQEDYEILEDVPSNEDLRGLFETLGMNLNGSNILLTNITYPLISSAVGYKVVGNVVIYTDLREYSSVFEFTYTFDDFGNLPFYNLTEEGIDSLTAYLGVDKFSSGDKLTVSGECYTAYVIMEKETYMNIDDRHCIESKMTVDTYVVMNYDIDITYCPQGETSGKSFTLKTSGCNRYIFDKNYVYDNVPVADDHNPCFIDYVELRSEIGVRCNLIFNGADHILTPIQTTHVPDDYTDEEDAELKSDVGYSSDDQVEVDDLYGSRLTDSQLKKKLESIGTVTYTYASVEKLMNNITGDVNNGDASSKLPWIIGGGVLGVAAVGGLVFFLIRRGST